MVPGGYWNIRGNTLSSIELPNFYTVHLKLTQKNNEGKVMEKKISKTLKTNKQTTRKTWYPERDLETERWH